MWDGRETLRDAASTELPVRHDDVLRAAARQPRQPGERRHARPRPGHRAAHDGAARRDRRFRARPLHRAAERRRRRPPRASTARNGGPTFLSSVVSYFGINDTLVGDYLSHAGFTPDGDDALPGLAVVPRGRRQRRSGAARPRASPSRVGRSPAARRSSTASRSPIRDVKGLNDDLERRRDRGHLHDLPQHAERRQPLGADAARHRPGRREPAHARHAALHPAPQDDRRNGTDDRSGPRADHRPLAGHRPLQGADPARAGRRARRTSTTARQRT